MRETIYTIPVNEVFEEVGGCPICRMRDELEFRALDYITGAAMMEPDIREMTNEIGFCERHFTGMLELGRNRLPICLTIETHLEEIGKKILSAADAGSLKRAERLESTCFVCDFIESNLARGLDTVYRSYRSEEEFRALFAKQEYICLHHYRRMLTEGKKRLGGSYRDFAETARKLAYAHYERLYGELKGFEDSFDHRNAGKPMDEHSRDAIERSIQFITGYYPHPVRKLHSKIKDAKYNF
ncbi:MAG: hypothetical protein E7559_06055 [Ruminococcaceae bacterium]|nr:hypothetical protein [Oscillospiraceae bacterium]